MLLHYKPMMLLSLPNSGSDWFAKCFLSDEKIKYFREFFNPIVNPNFENQLIECFGCELPGTIEMIAAPHSKENLMRLVQQTWKTTNYNFTKENYSTFKIDFFHQIFQCFILRRKLELCLPGFKREQVMTWYCSLFQSLKHNLHHLESLDKNLYNISKTAIQKANTINKQQVAAHVIYDLHQMKQAKKFNIIVFEYDELMTASFDELENKIKTIDNILNSSYITEMIIKTRIPKIGYYEKLGKDTEFFANELRQEYENTF
jgi:hypothetical protein